MREKIQNYIKSIKNNKNNPIRIKKYDTCVHWSISTIP